MTSYKVGYKKPPMHSQFKPRNNANPLGRGARKQLKPMEAVAKVLNAHEIVTDRGKTTRMSRIQRMIRRYGNAALKGDTESASLLLDLRRHFEKEGDINPIVVLISREDKNA